MYPENRVSGDMRACSSMRRRRDAAYRAFGGRMSIRPDVAWPGQWATLAHQERRMAFGIGGQA